MKYIILTAFDEDALMRKVNDYLDNGWEPQGGVSVSAWWQTGTPLGEHWELYAQAVVHKGYESARMSPHQPVQRKEYAKV